MLQMRKLRLRGKYQTNCPRPARELRFQPRSVSLRSPGPFSPPAISRHPTWNEKVHDSGGSEEPQWEGSEPVRYKS